MVIRRDSRRRVDQALGAAAELWDSGPDWAVLPWWIVGCAAWSPGESAEEEQEQESELGGHRRGQTGSHEMLWGLEPRLPSQEQESELLDTSEGEILPAGRRRGQTGSQWCPARRPSQEQESELLDSSEHYSGAPEERCCSPDTGGVRLVPSDVRSPGVPHRSKSLSSWTRLNTTAVRLKERCCSPDAGGVRLVPSDVRSPGVPHRSRSTQLQESESLYYWSFRDAAGGRLIISSVQKPPRDAWDPPSDPMLHCCTSCDRFKSKITRYIRLSAYI